MDKGWVKIIRRKQREFRDEPSGLAISPYLQAGLGC
jgi:hypothetical protein